LRAVIAKEGIQKKATRKRKREGKEKKKKQGTGGGGAALGAMRWESGTKRGRGLAFKSRPFSFR
jgi:hypothetical protein